MKKFLLFLALVCITSQSYCWGFFAHKKINYLAVFLLPPQMLVLYKPNIEFISEHAVDPDKRRYAVAAEGPRHYIDIDYYGKYPYLELPHNWKDAVAKYSEDTLQANGIVPWHVQNMLARLTNAFKEKNFSSIMKNSAEIGHYIADAHVPLHASSNHNGQLTNQKGIHAFWESRVPELLADKQFDFFIGKAEYIKNPGVFIWDRVLESGHEADSVLSFEKELSLKFPGDKKYAFEKRNNIIIRQYSSAYTVAYNRMLNGMVERRMRQSIFAVASFWYTAWVNAGQPDLSSLSKQSFTENELKEFEVLNEKWQTGKIKGRDHEEGR
ncbi:MAG: zinc dependent phospholipase C family protein [Bacteroidota bacterium]|nr:zinc dependent phospholipase C family protein [Bacteroidota bacterium]